MTQRGEKRCEERLEGAEKNKKKENKTDVELRKHNEKNDGRKKMRILKDAC